MPRSQEGICSWLRGISLSPGVYDYVVLLTAIIAWQTEILLFSPGVHAQPTLLLTDRLSASTARPYRRRVAKVAPAGSRFHDHMGAETHSLQAWEEAPSPFLIDL